MVCSPVAAGFAEVQCCQHICNTACVAVYVLPTVEKIQSICSFWSGQLSLKYSNNNNLLLVNNRCAYQRSEINYIGQFPECTILI